MKGHFAEMARYNAWANARIYADSAALSEDALRRDVGVYFGSLFATFEHILKVDLAWLHLLGGGTLADLPVMPGTSEFAHLRQARALQDSALIERVDAADEAWLDAPFEFRSALASWRDKTYRGTHASVLTHVFNHQTHHRGHAHTGLSLLGAEPSALDMLVKGFLDG